MAFDTTTASAGFAALAAGNVTVIPARNAAGFGRRKLTVRNNTNVTLTLIVFLTDPGNGAIDMLVFTITAGGIAIVTEGAGFASSFGGTYARTFGNEAAVNGPAAQASVQVNQNAGATSGSVGVELVQQG